MSAITMTCLKCKFEVPPSMRFALMSNTCPSCGSPLFSNEDMGHIQIIENKISTKGFASDFDKVQRYDLSLFIFNEIKLGIGKDILNRKLKHEIDLLKAEARRVAESNSVEKVVEAERAEEVQEDSETTTLSPAVTMTPDGPTNEKSEEKNSGNDNSVSGAVSVVAEAKREVEEELRDQIAKNLERDRKVAPKPKPSRIVDEEDLDSLGGLEILTEEQRRNEDKESKIRRLKAIAHRTRSKNIGVRRIS